MTDNALELARKYWERMNTNDFRSVGLLISDDFFLDWPQSNERIRGPDNLAAMNEQYSAYGRWQFTVNRIVGNDNRRLVAVGWKLISARQHREPPPL